MSRRSLTLTYINDTNKPKVLIIIGDATEPMATMSPSYFRLIDSNLISGRSFWDHGLYMDPRMKLVGKARDAQS